MPVTPPTALHRWIERDRSIAQALQRVQRYPWLLWILIAASRLGDGMVWYGTMLLLPLAGGAQGMACVLRMLLLGTLNVSIYRIIKRHFARPRPFVTCPGVRAGAPCLDVYSFPSGHTMHAIAFGALLSNYYPALGWVVWPFAALVAASRVMLGLHYPSDVIAGAALGAATAYSALSLF